MALKSILNTQTDFTGEFPAEYAKDGLWRFNEIDPDADTMLEDSSGKGRRMFVNNWLGTTAELWNGQKGRYIRINMDKPSTEKTYLKVANDGSIFSSLGERIIVGGWISPTTYSTSYIKGREDWEFVHVYTDEGISATGIAKREGFKKMVEDALSGRVDLIVTKSVSRFARNTVDSCDIWSRYARLSDRNRLHTHHK